MPGFLKLILCGLLYVCMFMCVSAPKVLITSGVTWLNIDFIWLTKFYSCYVATVVGIVDGCGLAIHTHLGN